MKRYNYNSITRKAEKFLLENNYQKLPINIKQIAYDLEIKIQKMPRSIDNVSGMLLRHGNDFVIAYASFANNCGFERFSIAHELGHYLLEGHFDAIFKEDKFQHLSNAGFVEKSRFEVEADYFAAGLLMPDPMFSKELIKYEDGLKAIKALAEICYTSITSTAIKYADKAGIPVAVVMSEKDQIDFCFLSETLKEFPNFTWLKKGDILPGNSETRRFNESLENITNSLCIECETDLAEWFECDYPIEAVEEVFGLGSYGKTLTVLSTQLSIEDIEDDREMTDKWTPRFRR